MFHNLCYSIQHTLILYNDGNKNDDNKIILKQFLPKLHIPQTANSDKTVHQTCWFKFKNSDMISCIPSVVYDFAFIIKG
jgi:hypothetical protein